jgi:hypothetical protein
MNENYLHSIRSVLLDCSHQRTTVDTVVQKLQTFENDLRQLSSQDRQSLIQTHLEILSAIKFELSYLLKEQSIGVRKADIIRCRDRIFGSLLRNVDFINERTKVTKLFNEFIKGITYFSNESVFDVKQPAYHRNGACPPKGSQNIECLLTNNATIKTKKKKEIRKCYIERLIYDNLWTRLIFSSQDIEHITWLEKTKKAYETCFPNIDIYIDVLFDEQNHIPCRLKIYEGDIEEIYEKRYDITSHSYVYPVDCIRTESNGNIKRKQSTFDNEGAWS